MKPTTEEQFKQLSDEISEEWYREQIQEVKDAEKTRCCRCKEVLNEDDEYFFNDYDDALCYKCADYLDSQFDLIIKDARENGN